MPTRKKIAFHTLGCKLNFSETAAISRQFPDKTYTRVAFAQPADIYVINSCTVTKNAEKRCKALIRQALKTNPAAKVAVMGCYSQIKPSELLAMPGVFLVLGNEEKYKLPDHLMDIDTLEKQGVSHDVSKEHLTGFVPAFSSGGRTRSFFKIQDGCDYRCAYCSIPQARGNSRSDTIARTLETAKQISGSNIREMVLTGVNIGDFGKPHGETFFELLTELVKLDRPERIRLSSIEPDLLHDDLIWLVADEPKLMPHFHLPLQSGSDSILKSMGRKYNTRLFAERIESIRKHMPHACIAADIIVGYPGETDALFRESLAFVSAMDVSYIHVFTYSERENTRALTKGPMVHPAERKQRSRLMQQCSSEKKQQFIRSNKGLTTKVLWENDEHNGFMFGFTENYLKTKTAWKEALQNTIQEVSLNHTDKHGVYIL